MADFAIDMKNVSKDLGRKKVLRDLSLAIPKGSVFGLLGKNGAGKTTLIKCALGLLRIQAGGITVLGDDPGNLHEDTKQKLGYVPQSDRIYPWLSVKQIINYTASFYSHWNDQLVHSLLNDWDLDSNDKVGFLSEGQAQMLMIILSLGHEPELLIFDEPVASLDPAARRQFLKTILKIVSDRECTVFFSTHITSDLERVADRVALLKDDKIDFCGELDVLKDEVKRLRIVAPVDISEELNISGLIFCERSHHEAIISVRGFKPEMKIAIEKQLKAEIEVEDLNLEEIFLELNR